MHSQAVARATSCALPVLLACLAALLLALALVPQAHASQPYAELSGKYESNTDAAYASYKAGAYGAYQLSAGNAKAYAQGLQGKSGKYRTWGNALIVAYVLDGSSCGYYFDAVWRYVAGGASATTGSAASDSTSNATRIAKVEKKMKKLGYATLSNGNYIAKPSASKALQFQYDFCISTFYEPAVALWEAAEADFDASAYSVALQNVIFSTAIQHGTSGSKKVFAQACERNGGFAEIAAEDLLITALYDERSRTTTTAPSSSSIKITASALSATYLAYANAYGLLGSYLVYFSKNSASVQVGVYVRLHVNEKADALALLASSGACTHSKTTGGKVTSYYALTDKNHKEKVSAKKCALCGATLKAAYSRTVANVFKRSGKSYKDASGRSYTPHAAGWYKVTASALNVRSKASTSGSIKTRLAKGRAVKVRKAKMGSDGFWWGKVKVGGKTGWVQMQYLRMLGTGCAHSFSGGKCTWCGVSKKAATRMQRIKKAVSGKGKRTCTFTAAAKSYKNAYAVGKQTVKSYKKGAKVTIVKVVRNVYNDYWGKTAGGTWVKLSKLK